MTRIARHIRRRRGTTLVLFAVLLFALLPMMALVLDLGIVRVTRRQMQTAANVAAIEGLRYRDSKTDVERRETARDTVKHLFDDNLAPTTPSTGFSAGPQAFLVPNTGTPLIGNSFRWSPQLMTDSDQLPVVTQFRPTLQLNSDDNKQHGDLVAGTYDTAAATNPDTLFTEKTTVSGMVTEYYQRNDFVASDVADAPTSRAFLARLRRTRFSDNDQAPDDEADVSSAGPPVPYVFGRGGLASGGTPDPNALWNQREAGVTVRATAIADARPALTVGPATPSGALFSTPTASPAIPGIAPFAFAATTWSQLSGTPRTIYISPEGRVSLDNVATDQGILFGVARLATLPDAAATSLVVEPFTGWRANIVVKIRVGPEIMRVMPNGTSTWPIEARGLDGTQAVDHTLVTDPAQIEVRKRIIRHEPMMIGYRVFADSHLGVSDAELQNTPNNALQAITDGWPSEEVFAPIYAPFGSAGDRVFAFGRIQLIPLGASEQDEQPAYKIDIKKVLSNQIAIVNASVCVMRPWNSTGVASTDVDLMFREARSLNSTKYPDLVLAPALVRTLGKLADSP